MLEVTLYNKVIAFHKEICCFSRSVANAGGVTRRARLRAQAMLELKQNALAQCSSGEEGESPSHVPGRWLGGPEPDLQYQMQAWRASYADFREELPTDILGSGILLWTRLHGILTLEIAGLFASMQIDAAGLCEAEGCARRRC